MNKEKDTEEMDASQKPNMWVATCSCAVPEPGDSFIVIVNFFSCCCDVMDPKSQDKMLSTLLMPGERK